MIAWLVGIITFVLALFIFWRARSAAYRVRSEAPKFRFLENLGIRPPASDRSETVPNPKENPDEPSHS